MEGDGKRFRTVALALVGTVCVGFGASAAIWDTGHRYAGCGHGDRVGVGGLIGAAAFACLLVIARRPRRWLVVTSLALMVFFVLGDTGLSNDYLDASSRCHYSREAANEDALSAGWLIFGGGIALLRLRGRRSR